MPVDRHATPSHSEGTHSDNQARGSMDFDAYQVAAPVVVAPNSDWITRFTDVRNRLDQALDGIAISIEHVGSTAIPGVAGRDIVDVQVIVGTESDLDVAAKALLRAGWDDTGVDVDHVPFAMQGSPTQWAKRWVLSGTPAPVNVHLRISGRANTRFALLFRDYLRVHRDTASTFGHVKMMLAEIAHETRTYTRLKDGVVDLIYLDAERWAETTGWTGTRR